MPKSLPHSDLVQIAAGYRPASEAIDRSCEARLVNDALAKASTNRSTKPVLRRLFESGQYTSILYTQRSTQAGTLASIGSRGYGRRWAASP